MASSAQRVSQDINGRSNPNWSSGGSSSAGSSMTDMFDKYAAMIKANAVAEPVEAEEEKKPAKKTAAKKTAKKAEEAPAEGAEEAPKKKTTRKKKAEETADAE